MLLFIFFFLFGLVIGSFLNVVVLRFETNESLSGRSHCPQCQALIHWYDNIPLFSYLILRGKCRSCQGPIAWQYPLVEFLTGSLFALIGYYFFAHMVPAPEAILTTLWYLILTSLLIVILVADMRTMEIPFIFLLMGVVGSILFILLTLILFHPESIFVLGAAWQLQLLGGGVAALLFYALVFFSRETWMGMGDVWLAAMVGLAVGIQGLLFTLTLSFLLGAIVGILLILLRQKQLQSQIPFAPFLVIGLWVSLILTWIYPWWLTFFLWPVA